MEEPSCLKDERKVNSGPGLLYDREEQNHDPGCSRLPSECRCPNVSWLWATHRLAVESVRSGKWMLFTDSDDVDSAWLSVVDLLAAGQLGSCAKAAPRSSTRDGQHLICVYTDDHEDVQDVFRVLFALRNSSITCASFRTLNYKTDYATNMGQYSSLSSAQYAGFEGAASKPHKNHKISKYTSPGFPGIKNVRLVLNNIGPDFLHEVVAELPVTSSQEEIEQYFSLRPDTASEISHMLSSADTDLHCSSHASDFSHPDAPEVKKARTESYEYTA